MHHFLADQVDQATEGSCEVVCMLNLSAFRIVSETWLYCKNWGNCIWKFRLLSETDHVTVTVMHRCVGARNYEALLFWSSTQLLLETYVRVTDCNVINAFKEIDYSVLSLFFLCDSSRFALALEFSFFQLVWRFLPYWWVQTNACNPKNKLAWSALDPKGQVTSWHSNDLSSQSMWF